MRVVGVDGCPGGWIAVLFDTDPPRWEHQIHSTFVDVVATYRAVKCIAVDVPIGLVKTGQRNCDVEARQLLGPRHVCVFNPPHPDLFDIPTHKEASARSISVTGKGISCQTFCILPKIAEVNRAMTRELQSLIVEVHPELSFAALADGNPLLSRKRTASGFSERAGLLAKGLQIETPVREVIRASARPAKPDDVLDALVAAWSAKRAAEGVARQIPADSQTDYRCLRIQMVI